MTEQKILTLKIDEKTYMAKWSLRAFKQHSKGFAELQKKCMPVNETEETEEQKKNRLAEFGTGYMDLGLKIAEGMFIRAGVTEEQFEDADPDIVIEMGRKIGEWYTESMMTLNNNASDETKGEAEKNEIIPEKGVNVIH